MPIGAEAGIKNDEVKAASVEGIMRLLLADPIKELVLRQRGDAVVAQDVVLVARQSRNLFVDPD